MNLLQLRAHSQKPETFYYWLLRSFGFYMLIPYKICVNRIHADEKRLIMTISFFFKSSFVNFWNLFRSSHWRCSVKKVYLKLSEILQQNTCVESFFIKLQAFRLRDSDTGVFLWNFLFFCETFFEEPLQTTASVCLGSLFSLFIKHQHKPHACMWEEKTNL